MLISKDFIKGRTLFKVKDVELIGDASLVYQCSAAMPVFDSLAPGRCCNNLKSMIFKLITQNSSLGTHCEISLTWMPQNLTNEKSTMVQVMVCCHEATDHHLSQCWPRSLSRYGVTRLQPVSGVGKQVIKIKSCECAFLITGPLYGRHCDLDFIKLNQIYPWVRVF